MADENYLQLGQGQETGGRSRKMLTSRNARRIYRQDNLWGTAMRIQRLPLSKSVFQEASEQVSRI